jgi:RimJ/RimL family protein N-acetyltransferase
VKLSPVVLENAFVRLEPVEERHRADLRAAAGDMSILKYSPSPTAPEAGFDGLFDWQTKMESVLRWVRFAVLVNGRAIGHTAYLAPRPYDRGVEIGATWYAPDYHRGPVNPSCKLLLLENAFGAGAERVELKTDALNAQSRAAILKLGASFEGIHRHHMLRTDGTWRDTAWYSVLREEWPGVREKLEQRLSSFPSPP